jgi:hypothetical protein
MRQPRTYAITQTLTYTPDTALLQDTWTPMTTHRASKCVSFVLGLALGTGVAVLLSLLSTWVSP